MAVKDVVGAYGERLVARSLAEQGWTVVDRNWRCELGEIDIVAVDGDCLVVVEVKTRRSDAFGGAIEAVTRRKLARLRKLAASWLAVHGGGFSAVRVDVVAVTLPRAGRAHVDHLRAVA